MIDRTDTPCDNCRYYYYERDTNYAECTENMDDDCWQGKKSCPNYKPEYEPDEYEPEVE